MIRVLFFILLFAEVAWGHQQKEALTSIAYNERSQSLEVVHRLSLHDAEEAARRLYGPKSDLNEGQQARDWLGQYVVEHFALRSEQGKLLPLNYVGHEIEGKYFWVYQEIALAEAITPINVHNSIFFDVWPGQANLVNVELAGRTKSITFRKGDDWHMVHHDIVITDGN